MAIKRVFHLTAIGIDVLIEDDSSSSLQLGIIRSIEFVTCVGTFFFFFFFKPLDNDLSVGG